MPKEKCQIPYKYDKSLYICKEVFDRTGFYHGVQKEICKKCNSKLIDNFCNLVKKYHQDIRKNAKGKFTFRKIKENQKELDNIVIIKYGDNNLSSFLKNYSYNFLKFLDKPVEIIDVTLSGKEFFSSLIFYKQILKGAKRTKAEYVFLLEEGTLCHISRFYFKPGVASRFYFQNNVFWLDETSYYFPFPTVSLSMAVVNREFLIYHLKEYIQAIKKNILNSNSLLGFRDIKGEQIPCIFYNASIPSIYLKNTSIESKFRIEPENIYRTNSIPFWGDYKELKKKIKLI